MSTTVSNHRCFSSEADDHAYRVSLPVELVDTMLRECRKDPFRETGGILTGHYAADRSTAILSGASRPPSDSHRTLTRFFRGVRGLNSMLRRLWHEGDYYVGEWHYHPHVQSMPSQTDIDQMAAIANDPAYACSNPILLIIGGDPADKWTLSIAVYSGDQKRLITLHQKSWINGSDATLT